MERRGFLRHAGATAVGGVALAGCSGGGGDGGENIPENTVDMVGASSPYHFDPIGLFVEPGTTVTFRNRSGAHSSTAYKQGNSIASVTRIPDGAEAWNSETLGDGESFDHTFETEGTYDYFCIPHKSLGMVGRIVVGQPGGPAEGSMPPDGEVPDSQTIVDEGRVRYDDFTG